MSNTPPHAHLAERVQLGAAWLDANLPGWWKKVCPERLDLGSCRRCVLGQLFGEFHLALAAGRHTFRWARALGFNGTRTETWALTNLWQRVVRQRRWNKGPGGAKHAA